MRQLKWNTLGPDDIEVRVQGNPKNGMQTYLLYQNSRTTGRAFDEMFGEFGWQLTYKDVGGQIYGCLSVWDETRLQWVTKEDTGAESNIEAQKGLSSDIFKRCAVRWGYARELYTAPKIVLPDTTPKQLNVNAVIYDEGHNMIYLKLVDNWGNVHFEWSKGQKPQTTEKQPSKTKEELIKDVQQQCNSLWLVTPKEQREVLKGYTEWWINRINEKGYDGTFNLSEKFNKHLEKHKKAN